MKKMSKAKQTLRLSEPGLSREYRFDYTKARPNRFAGRRGARPVVVLLDPDVAAVFKNGEAANAALRALLPATGARHRSRA